MKRWYQLRCPRRPVGTHTHRSARQNDHLVTLSKLHHHKADRRLTHPEVCFVQTQIRMLYRQHRGLGSIAGKYRTTNDAFTDNAAALESFSNRVGHVKLG